MPKVALVHDWLVSYRGGEKVLEAIAEMFPSAEIFTLFYEPGSTSRMLESRTIHRSFLDRIPGARARYRHLLPLLPWAIESMVLKDFDLIISSSHCVAKGISRSGNARHLSYVHAPMRYMWDRFDDYFGPKRASRTTRLAAHLVRPFLQTWDVASSKRVDKLVANSRFIAAKIAEYYHREATVIYPPVELEKFVQFPLEGSGRGNYFLWLGALAPYKRVDIAIEAFRRLKLPLWIAGEGQEAKSVMRNLPSHIKWLGRVSDEELPELYRNARAFIFTAEEDFGLTPLESQASGRPVIAYAKGGALETVTSRTGLFFHQQTPEALGEAVRAFEAWEADFEPQNARTHALGFSKAAFQERLRQELVTL